MKSLDETLREAVELSRLDKTTNEQLYLELVRLAEEVGRVGQELRLDVSVVVAQGNDADREFHLRLTQTGGVKIQLRGRGGKLNEAKVWRWSKERYDLCPHSDVRPPRAVVAGAIRAFAELVHRVLDAKRAQLSESRAQLKAVKRIRKQATSD